jgi:RHS repeat-associated protein
MQRGTLTAGDSSITSMLFAQCWRLDTTDNWQNFREDSNGDGVWELVQNRAANPANKLSALSSVVGPSWVTPTYDSAGNLTTMPFPASPVQGLSASYDAWNRTAAIQKDGGALASYQYDGLGRRLIQVNDGTRIDLYFSINWQVVEERVGGLVNAQYVWNLGYADCLVLRDRDSTGSGVLTERMYPFHDANWNVTGIVDASGTPKERYLYQAYGLVTFLTPNWAVQATSGFSWICLFQGGRFDSTLGICQLRMRDYNVLLGQFTTRDPLGYYQNSFNDYSFVFANPITAVDPLGLWCLEVSRRPLFVPRKVGSQQLGIFFLQYAFIFSGTMSAKTCTTCCPNGTMVQDASVSVAATISLSGYAGVGLGIKKSVAGFSVFGYAGLRLGLTGSGTLQGSGSTDKCKGESRIRFEACGRFSLVGSITGGFNLNIRWGYFAYQVAAEIFGTASTTTELCLTYSDGSFSVESHGFTPLQYHWGFNFCLGQCYTIYIA